MDKKPYYICMAIAYVNGNPHIGHAMEMIQSDCLARYHRMLGEETYFQTGTDEFGSKIYKCAQEAGVDVQELADQNYIPFKKLTTVLNISHDNFIRTSSKAHQTGAQKVWEALTASDDIYKDSYEGLYCVGCEAYLQTKDLIDGKCVNHKKEPESIQEENYFFRLSKYNDQIKELIKSDKLKIHPKARKNEMLALLDKGLQDISFSRPKTALPWGVEVPNDPEHVMYVWCDALSNYITGLDYENNSQLFQKFWPAQIQIIGKDILRFHAGIWIGMLLSMGLPTPKELGVHGFITSEGHKMSKSLGNVVDPFDLTTEFGTDPVRYFLLREIPTTDDGDFSRSRFTEVYDSELANNLGNLLSRVTAMIQKYNYGATNELKLSSITQTKLEETWQKYHNYISEFDLKKALENVMHLCDYGNQFIEKTRPWELVKREENEQAIDALTELIELLRQVSLMLTPYTPETATKIQAQLGFQPEETLEKSLAAIFPAGHKVNKGEPLFPRLES